MASVTTSPTGWHYGVNQIENSSKRSFHRSAMIFESIDHRYYNEITDPVILDAYNLMHPGFVLFGTVYSEWLAKIGFRIGEVNRWENMRLDIKDTQLDIWKSTVIVAGYPKKSSDYLAIFPHGSYDFNTDITTFIANL